MLLNFLACMLCCPISDQVMLPQRNLYFYTSPCARTNADIKYYSKTKRKFLKVEARQRRQKAGLAVWKPLPFPLPSRSTTITLLISFPPTGEEIKTESTRKLSNSSF